MINYVYFWQTSGAQQFRTYLSALKKKKKGKTKTAKQ